MYITVFISGLESAFSPCTSTSSSQQVRFSVLRPRIPLKARLQPISENRKQANGFMYIRGYAFMSIVGLFLLFFLSINDVGVGQTLSPKKYWRQCHIWIEYWLVSCLITKTFTMMLHHTHFTKKTSDQNNWNNITKQFTLSRYKRAFTSMMRGFSFSWSLISPLYPSDYIYPTGWSIKLKNWKLLTFGTMDLTHLSQALN